MCGFVFRVCDMKPKLTFSLDGTEVIEPDRLDVYTITIDWGRGFNRWDTAFLTMVGEDKNMQRYVMDIDRSLPGYRGMTLTAGLT